MTELIEDFITIWNTYCNILSNQAYDFNKFIIIINKLRQKSKLEIKEKKIFIELIEIMASTIYTINNYADKYGTNYFQQTKKYEEPELNCCSNLLNYLETDLYWGCENEYDIAFAKSLLSDKMT